ENRRRAMEADICSFIVRTPNTGSSGSTSWMVRVSASLMVPASERVRRKTASVSPAFLKNRRVHTRGRRHVEPVVVHIADHSHDFRFYARLVAQAPADDVAMR